MKWSELDFDANVIKPGDRLLLTFHSRISQEQAAEIRDAAREHMPDVEVLVMSEGEAFIFRPPAPVEVVTHQGSVRLHCGKCGKRDQPLSHDCESDTRVAGYTKIVEQA